MIACFSTAKTKDSEQMNTTCDYYPLSMLSIIKSLWPRLETESLLGFVQTPPTLGKCFEVIQTTFEDAVCCIAQVNRAGHKEMKETLLFVLANALLNPRQLPLATKNQRPISKIALSRLQTERIKKEQTRQSFWVKLIKLVFCSKR